VWLRSGGSSVSARCAARRRFIAPLAALAALVVAASAHAQDGGEAPRPDAQIHFRHYRWQEDYLWLARKPGPLDAYERMKYLHLGGAPENFLSLGGELRYRLDRYDPYLFGLTTSGTTWSSHQERALFHADLHLTPHFRAFVQLDAAKEDGRPVRRAFDQSAPDLRQAFADLVLPTGPGAAMLRAGRQELWLGHSRWLAVRDPTNIRRSFDGGLVEYKDANAIVRGFAARPVTILPGAFDDESTAGEFFRGVYAIARHPVALPLALEFYLMGRRVDSATYARGSGREDRWTAGAHVVGEIAGLDYVAEGAYQFGRFDATDIAAWALFGDVSRPVALASFAPRFGLRGLYASGDRDRAAPTLRTFAAPYAATYVVSQVSVFSASNVANLQPYVQLALPHDVHLGASWNWVWRASTADAVYGPPGVLIQAPGSQAKEVAQIAQASFTWDVNRFLRIHALYAHVFAGDFIRDARGRDFDYYRLQVMQRY
jgi:hypothetical protein